MSLYDYIVVVCAVIGGAGVCMALVLLTIVFTIAWKERL